MGLSFWLGKIEVVLFSPVYNSGHRDFLSVLAPQLIQDVAVVIGADRHIFILYQAFLDV